MSFGQGFQTAVQSNTSFHCTLVGRDHKSKRRIPVLALLKLEKHFGTRTDRLQEVQHVTQCVEQSACVSNFSQTRRKKDWLRVSMVTEIGQAEKRRNLFGEQTSVQALWVCVCVCTTAMVVRSSHVRAVPLAEETGRRYGVHEVWPPEW